MEVQDNQESDSDRHQVWPEKRVTWSRHLLQVRNISPRQKTPRTSRMVQTIKSICQQHPTKSHKAGGWDHEARGRSHEAGGKNQKAGERNQERRAKSQEVRRRDEKAGERNQEAGERSQEAGRRSSYMSEQLSAYRQTRRQEAGGSPECCHFLCQRVGRGSCLQQEGENTGPSFQNMRCTSV